MPLNSSGAISIGGSTAGQSINLELGRAATASSNLNESGLRTLAGVASGQISLSNFYGKSNRTGTATPNVEYLLVGGGGGSGTNFSSWTNVIYGAGGAGGYISGTGFAVTSDTAITVTVGAGGSVKGSDSVFSSLTAQGGGAGCANPASLKNGGSGGGIAAGTPSSGGIAAESAVGTGVTGQGFAGGSSTVGYLPANTTYPLAPSGALTGGGGGASAAATNGRITLSGSYWIRYAGNGGNGSSSSITGTSITYAGGGAGTGWAANGTAMPTGTAGTGGGGAANTSGTANRGGGAGSSVNTAVNGGSGTVVIRYPNTYRTAITTGSPTYTNTGGYHIYVFTGSGSINF